jgi:hypothetical protein
MHANIGINGSVRALTVAERMMNNGLVVTSTSFVASPGFRMVFTKLPVKGRYMIPEKTTEITNIIIIKTATQPIFDQKFLWASFMILLIVLPIFIPSTIITGKIKRYSVITYIAAKKAPIISTNTPRIIAMDPAKARRIIIIIYGIKYFRDLTAEMKMLFSLLRGLKII